MLIFCGVEYNYALKDIEEKLREADYHQQLVQVSRIKTFVEADSKQQNIAAPTDQSCSVEGGA